MSFCLLDSLIVLMFEDYKSIFVFILNFLSISDLKSLLLTIILFGIFNKIFEIRFLKKFFDQPVGEEFDLVIKSKLKIKDRKNQYIFA